MRISPNLVKAYRDNFLSFRYIVVAYLRARFVLSNGEVLSKATAAVTQSNPHRP